MGFLSSLFGGDKSPPSKEPKVLAEAEYEGFCIQAIEMRVGSEYQLCGQISQEIDGETRVHHLIRADRLSNEQAAAEAAISKAKQVIDEQGQAIFPQAVS